jgi:hypothetical protein
MYARPAASLASEDQAKGLPATLRQRSGPAEVVLPAALFCVCPCGPSQSIRRRLQGLKDRHTGGLSMVPVFALSVTTLAKASSPMLEVTSPET